MTAKLDKHGPVSNRDLNRKKLTCDLAVIGGGLPGTCTAITAAREGIKVVLVQDRPVLGGNASSEVRLWVLGATSHMGNNNRWSREGGVINELLVENMYRNPEGNTIIFDTILLEWVRNEPNITLLLNTAVYETRKQDPQTIKGVTAFNSQNATLYEIDAPLFCDASGDGIVGFQAGAAFRMGAEATTEFNEGFAPDDSYGALLGHSMYFMTKTADRPVTFVAPSYALSDITEIPRFQKLNTTDQGCSLWWLEWGGRLDTVHATEEIKWELWKVIYGIWNHIKNSGKFPDASHLTLEWVGQVPGKRESRRFEGDYMLIQSDLVQQRHFADTVAHGGWAIDLHPADGVFSEKPGCNQYHAKGVYEIPYRTMLSRNLDNLFLAGRIISASHVAFGSTRVMATVSQAAQAVGVAAAMVIQKGHTLRELESGKPLEALQQRLLSLGQHIPHLRHTPEQSAPTVTTEDTFRLGGLPFDGGFRELTAGTAQLIPLRAGTVPAFTVELRAAADTVVRVRLRRALQPFNYTPEVDVADASVSLTQGLQRIDLQFAAEMPQDSYVFLTFDPAPGVFIRESKTRVTGLLSVFNTENEKVSTFGRQEADEGLGFDNFEFWLPERRPGGQNLAFECTPPLNCFEPENLTNGFYRPYVGPNAWVADPEAERAVVELSWPEPTTLSGIVLYFDPDYDHPMESSLMGHPERIMPFMVQSFRIEMEDGTILHNTTDNHQSLNRIAFPENVRTKELRLTFFRPSANVPIAVFGINCLYV